MWIHSDHSQNAWITCAIGPEGERERHVVYAADDDGSRAPALVPTGQSAATMGESDEAGWSPEAVRAGGRIQAKRLDIRHGWTRRTGPRRDGIQLQGLSNLATGKGLARRARSMRGTGVVATSVPARINRAIHSRATPVAGYGVSPHIAHGIGARAHVRQTRKPITGQRQGDDEQNHEPELAHGEDQSIGPKQCRYPSAGTLTRRPRRTSSASLVDIGGYE